jgi:hypothetical protein
VKETTSKDFAQKQPTKPLSSFLFNYCPRNSSSAMDATESQDAEGIAARLTGPVRIVVQTATHLVPGDAYFGKCEFMRNKICQAHWKYDWDYRQHRWAVYGSDFAFANRRCYFVIDHGQSTDEDDVQVLFYEWTGEDL